MRHQEDWVGAIKRGSSASRRSSCTRLMIHTCTAYSAHELVHDCLKATTFMKTKL
jgi:hypothetical protein